MGQCEQAKINYASEKYRQAETVGFQTVTRQTEIPAQLERLEKETAILAQVIEHLQERLEQALSDEPRELAAKGGSIEQSPPCQMAHKIWEIKNSVERAVAKVQELLNRLEL